MKRPATLRAVFARPVLLVAGAYALVVALITAPWWLRPGYVWLLDSVWGPHPQIHWAAPTADLPWQIVVSALTQVWGGPVAEKLLLSLILVAIGLAGYYLARRLLTPAWAWMAGFLYLLNPFVYERLAAGQWIVLAGYAFLPIVLATAWDVLEGQGRRGAYRLAAWLALYPLISQHFAYLAAGLLGGLFIIYMLIRRSRWLLRARTLWWIAGAVGAILVLNAFWLLAPGGPSAHLPNFGSTAFATFRTAADPQFGAWGNALAGYGFWRGSAFFSPKDFVPLWWLVALAVWACATVGAVRAWRERSYLALTVALAALIAVPLAVGYATPATRAVTDALIAALPGYRGLRDTSKLIGVVMLAAALLAPLGARYLAGRLSSAPWAGRLTLTALGLLAATSVTGLWGGYSGQVPVADYPAGWHSAADRLAATPGARAAVMPWHGYLHLGFAHNAYVAQPAAVFFPTPVVTSRSLDNDYPESSATGDLDTAMIGLLTGTVTPADWAAQLKHRGLTHAVLLKTDDWEPYAEAIGRAGLRVEYDDPTVTLYKL